jgi:transcriptional regulator with XRE-family HTH domain
MNSKTNSHPASLGTLLRQNRRQKGLTLKQAAKRLGISFTYLSEIELGRRDPSDALLQRMSEVFGVAFEELCKADRRIPIESLRSAIYYCPEIGLELRRIFSSVDQGKIRPEKLARQLSKVR